MSTTFDDADFPAYTMGRAAEVIGYDDLVAAGGWDAARSKGLLRTESRSYVVREGDVLHIRFNV